MRCDGYEFKGTVEKVKSTIPAKIDLAVLLIFFNRPEHISQVFDAVKDARPSRLYLYQDGARSTSMTDVENVRLCREAVSTIDWQCEVHRLYQEENFGCDPSEYIAQKWMFETEEMGVILEDDDIPSQSFFPYAKELLERYRDEEKIAIICGMNNYDVEDSVEESYFFSKRGSIWGWASWKRVIDKWIGDYSWLDDDEAVNKVRAHYDTQKQADRFIATAIQHRATGREHYESILAAYSALNDTLNIVPKYNMICNIGISDDATHAASNIKLLTRRNQKLINKKVYEIDFPLKHPSKIEWCIAFDKKYNVNIFQKFWDLIEMSVRRLVYDGVGGFFKAANRRHKRRCRKK